LGFVAAEDIRTHPRRIGTRRKRVATLVLARGPKVLQEFSFSEGDTLTIGRRRTNTIVIEEPIVSGAHAKVDCLDTGVLITDLGSKNGTFVEGRAITAYWLKDKDQVAVGSHVITFHLEEGWALSLDDDDLDQTMVVRKRKQDGTLGLDILDQLYRDNED
jgi:pSer/pThr/pTyr-binding forkhead associated (FHA) protein